jgi:hypothetical protein
MFLKPEDIENVRVSSQHRAWLGLLTTYTGEETQWNSNDTGVVRVHQGTPSLLFTTTTTTTTTTSTERG